MGSREAKHIWSSKPSSIHINRNFHTAQRINTTCNALALEQRKREGIPSLAEGNFRLDGIATLTPRPSLLAGKWPRCHLYSSSPLFLFSESEKTLFFPFSPFFFFASEGEIGRMRAPNLLPQKPGYAKMTAPLCVCVWTLHEREWPEELPPWEELSEIVIVSKTFNRVQSVNNSAYSARDYRPRLHPWRRWAPSL